MISYGMDNICRPSGEHMVIRIGLKKYTMDQ